MDSALLARTPWIDPSGSHSRKEADSFLSSTARNCGALQRGLRNRDVFLLC
jgi:hypothetical protein